MAKTEKDVKKTKRGTEAKAAPQKVLKPAAAATRTATAKSVATAKPAVRAAAKAAVKAAPIGKTKTAAATTSTVRKAAATKAGAAKPVAQTAKAVKAAKVVKPAVGKATRATSVTSPSKTSNSNSMTTKKVTAAKPKAATSKAASASAARKTTTGTSKAKSKVQTAAEEALLEQEEPVKPARKAAASKPAAKPTKKAAAKKAPAKKGRKAVDDDEDFSEIEEEFEQDAADEAVEAQPSSAEKAKPLRMKLSKAKERALMKEFGLDEAVLSEEEIITRRQRLKELIKLGKTRGYLTNAEISDHLPDKLVDAETLEMVISRRQQ